MSDVSAPHADPSKGSVDDIVTSATTPLQQMIADLAGVPLDDTLLTVQDKEYTPTGDILFPDLNDTQPADANSTADVIDAITRRMMLQATPMIARRALSDSETSPASPDTAGVVVILFTPEAEAVVARLEASAGDGSLAGRLGGLDLALVQQGLVVNGQVGVCGGVKRHALLAEASAVWRPALSMIGLPRHSQSVNICIASCTCIKFCTWRPRTAHMFTLTC